MLCKQQPSASAVLPAGSQHTNDAAGARAATHCRPPSQPVPGPAAIARAEIVRVDIGGEVSATRYGALTGGDLTDCPAQGPNCAFRASSPTECSQLCRAKKGQPCGEYLISVPGTLLAAILQRQLAPAAAPSTCTIQISLPPRRCIHV